MKIIFENNGRRFEADEESIADIYQAVKDGLVAMSFTQKTVDEWFPEDL